MNQNKHSLHISDDPMDRVPNEMKGLLNDPKIFFDIHCHVFTHENVPDKFLGMRIPMNKRILSFLENLLHDIIKKSDLDKFSRIANFLKFLRNHSSKQLTHQLLEYYPKRTAILTPLLMDIETGIEGEVKQPYIEQIQNMRDLQKSMPHKLLPFLCIDPNRPNVKELFLEAFSSKEAFPFFGVKVYPSLGYLPSHPVLMDIFSICEEKNIPVTAHCGGARVHNSRKYLNVSGIRKNGKGKWEEFQESKRFRNKKAYSNYFNEPTNWEPVLDKYPNLKLNLAHFGGVKDWKLFCNGSRNNRVSRILDMMGRYDHLYADFSYTFHVQKYNEKLKRMIEDNQLLADRVLFGSDFYMVVLEGNYKYILANFIFTMGDKIMEQIGVNNPKRFLFDRVNVPSQPVSQILFSRQAYQPFFG